MTQLAGNGDALGMPAEPPDTSRLAPTELRSIFGMFATGVTVVTAGAAVGAHGMTANSFTSVSLRPPLVLICVLRSARMHQSLLEGRTFGISVLSAQQRPLAKYFAERRPADGQEFEVVDWWPGPRTGVPIIGGSLAWMECRLESVYAGGDHSIFLGEVLDSGRDAEAEALLFFGGRYRDLEPADPGGPGRG